MDFAKRLKELRASRGLTQDDLARELNLVKSSISMYENGKRKPSFEVLEAIADYFNVNMDTLYSSAPVFVPSLKRVPMLGYAAAGQPLENLDGQDTYYVETDSRYAVDFCITVRGDSMINAGSSRFLSCCDASRFFPKCTQASYKAMSRIIVKAHRSRVIKNKPIIYASNDLSLYTEKLFFNHFEMSHSFPFFSFSDTPYGIFRLSL